MSSRSRILVAALSLVGLLVGGGGAYAWRGTAQDMEMPGPGPEHKLLEKWAGEWTAKVEMSMGPGPAEKSDAKSSVKLTCGGLWLVTDYSSTVAGAPFFGHELRGYDPATQKYVINWVDSWTSSFGLGEGTWDEATKTLTSNMKSSDAHEWRQIETWKDADTREYQMLQKGASGKESVVIRITYSRVK